MVADFDHPNGQLIILSRTDNAVIPLANAVFFLSGELFAANGARIISKSTDLLHYLLQGFIGDGVQILSG